MHFLWCCKNASFWPPLIPVYKELSSDGISVVRLVPAEHCAMFVWLDGILNNDSVTVYIGYNIIPDPELLIREMEVKLPTTAGVQILAEKRKQKIENFREFFLILD